MKIPEGQTPPEVVELIKDIIKDKTVCDIGCGSGAFMESLKKYASKVIGIEEETNWANIAASKGFDIYNHNTFFFPLPKADVYYLWTKDCMGVYLKAKYEGTTGTFIFGHSNRVSTKKFLEENCDEIRGNEFKVYIKK